VEQERMANAQLLMYGSKHLEQNFYFFVFLKKCEYPMVLSDLENPAISVDSMKEMVALGDTCITIEKRLKKTSHTNMQDYI
jgi:hypothetical protein